MEQLIGNLCFAWKGDYEALKRFVDKDLNIDGVWEQPGSDKKVFKSNNILISWRRGKNLLHLEGAEAGKVVQRLCSKICQGFVESVTLNDSVNEVVVVNDAANSCETDLDAFESRVGKDSAVCSDIEALKTGQAINTEAIQSLSESVVRLTEVLAKFQENMGKSRKNAEVQFDNESNFMQEEIAGQELNNENNSFETNGARESNYVNATKRTGLNNTNVNSQLNIQLNKTKTPKHLVPCPFVRRRGHCLKGSQCDFLHRNTNSRQSTQKHQWQNPQPFFHKQMLYPFQTFPFPMRIPTFHQSTLGPYPPSLMEVPTRLHGHY